jgi:hypothetical protein
LQTELKKLNRVIALPLLALRFLLAQVLFFNLNLALERSRALLEITLG